MVERSGCVEESEETVFSISQAHVEWSGDEAATLHGQEEVLLASDLARRGKERCSEIAGSAARTTGSQM